METSGLLNLPEPLYGNATVFWTFAVATTAMVAYSIWLAISETIRTRTWLPVVVFVSAALWLPNEPFIDSLLGFQYAHNSPVVLFTLWERVIPLTVLGVGAMFFIFPWLIYRMVCNGTSMRQIVVISVIAGVIDWPLEWMAIHWDVLEYYHNASTVFGLPITSMVQNCFIYALMAAAILFAEPYLTGWRAILFVPVIPGVYLGGAALCTWPAYLGLHAQWPPVVFVPLAIVSAAMNVYIPLTVLTIAARNRTTAADPSLPTDTTVQTNIVTR